MQAGPQPIGGVAHSDELLGDPRRRRAAARIPRIDRTGDGQHVPHFLGESGVDAGKFVGGDEVDRADPLALRDRAIEDRARLSPR